MPEAQELAQDEMPLEPKVIEDSKDRRCCSETSNLAHMIMMQSKTAKDQQRNQAKRERVTVRRLSKRRRNGRRNL